MTAALKAPFPYFGGKSAVSDLVWDRFGHVANYIEPFFGSGAVLLGRPTTPGIETVNDIDCMIANFWRALKNDPEAVAEAADWPVNEADQHARHRWLCSQADFRECMKVDPDFYDPKIAGWWVWGQCIWIGSGWCSRQLSSQVENPGTTLPHQLPHLGSGGHGVHRKLPHLGSAGQGLHRNLPYQIPNLRNTGTGIHRKLPNLGGDKGVHRRIPHLGDAGKGIHRKSIDQNRIPHLGDAGTGIHRKSLENAGIETQDALLEYMLQLAERMRHVRVCCGDWSRICGPSPTFKLGITGVFLDPPYSASAGQREIVYTTDDLQLAHTVREWAISNGRNPDLRIALCGYEGEYDMPSEWECVAWKAHGGYGSQGNGIGRANSFRERIWFSPHCIQQQNLFTEIDTGDIVTCI